MNVWHSGEMEPDDLLRRLRRLATQRAWVINETQGGRHIKLRLNNNRTVIGRHKGDLPKGTLRKIRKDHGLTDDDLKV